MPALAASSNSCGKRRLSPWPTLAEKRPRLAVPRMVPPRVSNPPRASVVEQHELARFQQALIAAEDAEGFPAALGGRLGHGTDDRVQSGAIAAAGDDADFFIHG